MTLADVLEQEYQGRIYQAGCLLWDRLRDVRECSGCKRRALFLLCRASHWMEEVVRDWSIFGFRLPDDVRAIVQEAADAITSSSSLDRTDC